MSKTALKPTRATQLKHAAAGRCEFCGRREPSSETLCGECLSAHNAATKALKDALIADNRCAWCGGKNRSGFRACDPCRERYNARRRVS